MEQQLRHYLAQANCLTGTCGDWEVQLPPPQGDPLYSPRAPVHPSACITNRAHLQGAVEHVRSQRCPHGGCVGVGGGPQGSSAHAAGCTHPLVHRQRADGVAVVGAHADELHRHTSTGCNMTRGRARVQDVPKRPALLQQSKPRQVLMVWA